MFVVTRRFVFLVVVFISILVVSPRYHRREAAAHGDPSIKFGRRGAVRHRPVQDL